MKSSFTAAFLYGDTNEKITATIYVTPQVSKHCAKLGVTRREIRAQTFGALKFFAGKKY